MHERMKRLLEERARIIAEMRAAIDLAETEKRKLEADEIGKIEKISDDVDAIDVELRNLEKYKNQAEAGVPILEAVKAAEVRGEPSGPDLNELFRKVAKREIPSFDVELPAKYEKRALLTTVPASAGNLVEDNGNVFAGALQNQIIEGNSFLDLGPTIFTTQNANTMEWPRQLTHMAAAQRVAENATIPKLADPTFGSVTMAARKYAGIAQISHEMIEDGFLDLSGLLVTELGDAITRAVNLDLYNGTGTNQPWGLITRVAALTPGVTGGSAAAPTFDNLIDLEHSLPQKYRANAAFYMHDSTLRTLRKVKDSTGAYIWQGPLTVGAPATILGHRYVTDENIAQVGASAMSVILGDPSQYWFRQVRTVRVERSDEYAFDTDLVSWKAVFRCGGDVMDLNAFKAYKSAA